MFCADFYARINPQLSPVFRLQSPQRHIERKMAGNQEDKSGAGTGLLIRHGVSGAGGSRKPGVSARSGEESWVTVPHALRAGNVLPPDWEALFGPLRRGAVDDLMVVAQVGQSLDGRIATVSGHSHYINGNEGLAHLHRLRALVDAVVVGIGTVLADDPQLTVRRVSGPHPARVVVDPRGRLPASARVLTDDGAARLVLTCGDAQAPLPSGVETIALPTDNGHIAPAAMLQALAARGFRRIMVEGGAQTVSRFLAAGCLDRLHIVVAPLILGAGPPAFDLAPIDRVDEALRPPVHIHRLGREVLFDCDLSAHRVAIGRAKMSL
jgi:diaminohydroxyphosphoribosylaminopyrimidine deaminase / 5-amino-6-(5-phosphoribosylamino)uracil reductase